MWSSFLNESMDQSIIQPTNKPTNQSIIYISGSAPHENLKRITHARETDTDR